jgi:hypothetical protein
VASILAAVGAREDEREEELIGEGGEFIDRPGSIGDVEKRGRSIGALLGGGVRGDHCVQRAVRWMFGWVGGKIMTNQKVEVCFRLDANHLLQLEKENVMVVVAF